MQRCGAALNTNGHFDTFEYLEGFSNRRRPHSSIASRSAQKHEMLYTAETNAP